MGINRRALRSQSNYTPVSLAELEQIKTPVTLIARDSDLIAPPLIMRMLSHIPNAALNVIPECGYSAYREQPDLFNRAIISFLQPDRSR